ncbi:MAG: MFS transporter [Planctomycetota bacterium]
MAATHPSPNPVQGAAGGPQAHWRRTYWVVWTANLITAVGMMSFLPFFPSLLEELGMQGEAAISRWSGICFAAAPLSATFSAPIWGAVGDRLGRKLMVCRALMAICVFVGGMAFVTSAWQLLALRIAQGMFSGFLPPSITLVSVAAPADRQGRLAGNLTTSIALGGLAGPMFGGLVAAQLGSHKSVFLVVGLLAGLSALLVWFGAVEDPATRREGQGGGGLRGAWNRPWTICAKSWATA